MVVYKEATLAVAITISPLLSHSYIVTYLVRLKKDTSSSSSTIRNKTISYNHIFPILYPQLIQRKAKNPSKALSNLLQQGKKFLPDPPRGNQIFPGSTLPINVSTQLYYVHLGNNYFPKAIY